MEGLNYQINEEENRFYNVNSSTLSPDLIEIEVDEDNADRYTYVPPRPGKHTVLITCNSRNERPDKHRACQARQVLWRGSSTVEDPYFYYPDATFFESPYNQWITNASEQIASMGELWSELVDQLESDLSQFRGVYSPNYEQKLIFSETITFKTSELPRWKPNSIIGKQNIEEDYA